MENGFLTLELEDGTTYFEHLLVEPQDGHLSMDSVMCFSEQIPEHVMDGGSDNGFAKEGKDVRNGEVLDGILKEDEVEYLRLPNFCSLGEEYLLGVEFAESITNLDYGSSDRLQTSPSDNLILASTASSDTLWKSDLFRTMDVSGCPSDQNVDKSELDSFPSSHECNILALKKPLQSPTSCKVQDNGKFYDISSSSFQEISSNDDNGSLSTSTDMQCSPKIEKNGESELACKDGETNNLQGYDALATTLAQRNLSDTYPTQKRSRKPTQRYIDALEDPMSRYSKKRRDHSSSNFQDRDIGVTDLKKCRMASRAVTLPTEETSVKAIQVPFGSLVHKKCPRSQSYGRVRDRSGNLKAKLKDSCATLENLKKTEECVSPFRLKRMDDRLAESKKRRDDGVTVSLLKKRNRHLKAASFRKSDDYIIDISSEESDEHVREVSQNKRDGCLVVPRQKKRAGFFTAESPEKVCRRRKHHIPWTIAEVKTLMDGVSQYGVGRWTQIKKLFFSTSAHRTSVDLKDKWRNLLKASGILERKNRKGKKKSNSACRPLPKSIIFRVCELATMYPYPRGQKTKIAHANHDSPDTSADMTLSAYRRIMRRTDDNSF